MNLPARAVWISLLLLSLPMAGCNPYRFTNRVYKTQVRDLAKIIREKPGSVPHDRSPEHWAGTVNFNLRKPNFVILHHTAQASCDQTLRTFTTTVSQVSAHYVICKNGTVFHMLNDYLRAWHGGLSRWGNLTDVNSASIGIELDNNGKEFFPEAQVESLLVLLDTLKRRYAIPAANVIAHADIAPTRKNDPNIYFPWKRLAEKGFGIWYGDTTGVTVPIPFAPLQALRIIGYDTSDSTAAIVAFKRHFVQDTFPRLNEADKKILYMLARQR